MAVGWSANINKRGFEKLVEYGRMIQELLITTTTQGETQQCFIDNSVSTPISPLPVDPTAVAAIPTKDHAPNG